MVVGDRMVDDKSLVPAAEAAARLGLSLRRVEAMIKDELLDATKIGGRWFVVSGSVKRRRSTENKSGRMLSPLNAWAVVNIASGNNDKRDPIIDKLSRWSRSHFRRRLAKEGLVSLAPRLRRRARARRFRADADDVANIRKEPGLVLAGVSAAADLGIDVIAPAVVEAYIRVDKLPRLVRKYYLAEDDQDPNVILHVIEERDIWPFPPGCKMVSAVVAALDLLEADDQRSKRAALEALSKLCSHQRLSERVRQTMGNNVSRAETGKPKRTAKRSEIVGS